MLAKLLKFLGLFGKGMQLTEILVLQLLLVFLVAANGKTKMTPLHYSL